MLDLDLLVEAAYVQSQLAAGTSSDLLRTRADGRAAVVLGRGLKRRPHRSSAWTWSEDDFLRANLGRIPLVDIAEQLGRSVNAVELRWKRDLHLTAPRRNPEHITAEQIAIGLGKDTKSVDRMIDRGILEGRRLPYAGQVCRVVDRVTFIRWVVDPMHWVYFDPQRVDRRKKLARYLRNQSYDAAFWAYVRRLLDRQRRRWKDRWLTVGEVEALWGVGPNTISQAIRRGRLPAGDWGNYWILKTVAHDPAYRIYPQKGNPGRSKVWTNAADRFLLIAKACGVDRVGIAARMKLEIPQVEARLYYLRKQKRIAGIIQRNRLKLEYDPRTKRFSTTHRPYFRKLGVPIPSKGRPKP